MSQKMNVVFASAEAAPFVKTGGLGDVAGSLPAALVRAGANVIVMVPKYATIADEYKQQMQHVCSFYVPLGWRNEYCGLERLDIDGVTYLFIDNERYFGRSYPYGFFDDGERFAYFSKAICESLQHLPEGFGCDILHCNDWHTALAPVFLREFYQGLPLYDNVRTVFSIHNIAFQGQFSDTILNDILGMAHIEPAARQLRCDERSINYMLGALNYADAISTVSPTYAWEIRTPEFGEGLDGVLRRREWVLSGILNGIDTDKFNPATDTRITANYTVSDRSGKAACKAALQAELGLTVRDDQPLMVMVTRLTRQKGMDLVMYSLDRILSGGVQVAVLGTGDADYENSLRYFEGKYPGQMAARIQFDPALSQRMYSGADMFLMPSLFEPCGLSQIIAMRYGTLPIVRETGGLKDTVQPYNQFTGEGTGFTFTHFNGDEMGDAVFRAARLFWDNRAAWDALVEHAMNADFSWTRSAGAYMDLYFGLHPEIPRPTIAEAPKHDDPEAAEEPQAEEAPKAEMPAKQPEAPATKAQTEAEETPEPAPAVTEAAASQPTEEAPKVAPKKTTTRKTTRTATAKKAATKPATATKAAASGKSTTKSSATKTVAASKTSAAAKASTVGAAAEEAPAEEKPAAKTAKAASSTATKTTSTTTKPKASASKASATKSTAARKTTTTKKAAAASTASKAEVNADTTHEPKHMAPEHKAAADAPAPKTAEPKTTASPTAPSTPRATSVSAARKTSVRKKR